MPTYAIGDLQGCYRELCDLLEVINFDDSADVLWFTGDLVNRGPESLSCLRFVKSLGDVAVSVLGNHDLHLLAVAAGQSGKDRKDTVDDILAAEDRDILLEWLKARPFLVQDTTLGFSMVHAGLPPQWDMALARECAREIENVLGCEDVDTFFSHMYGDLPDIWSTGLDRWDRLRFITNCFTRIRYCHRDGRINLAEKGPPGNTADGLLPWYAHHGRKSAGTKIIFGHWSTARLGTGQDFETAAVYPLDTGCIWGGDLTALRLEDGCYFSVPSRQVNVPGDQQRSST